MTFSKTQQERAKARSHAANAARKKPQPGWDWDRALAGLRSLLSEKPVKP